MWTLTVISYQCYIYFFLCRHLLGACVLIWTFFSEKIWCDHLVYNLYLREKCCFSFHTLPPFFLCTLLKLGGALEGRFLVEGLYISQPTGPSHFILGCTLAQSVLFLAIMPLLVVWHDLKYFQVVDHPWSIKLLQYKWHRAYFLMFRYVAIC